ncbi:type II toxin-antitoxin system RelE/ParE family toxin [Lactovum odontotermitis]
MEYFGATSKLAKLLSSERNLIKEYGKKEAAGISKRLEEFRLADNLAMISHLPPSKLHKLRGDRDRQFAVWITENYRLVFEAYDIDDVQTTDKAKAVTISIIGIEDYH